MPHRRRPPCLSLFALLALSACENNVGRAFDPGFGGPGGGGTPSSVALAQIGGRVRTGRPSIVEIYPRGGGWPGTVPVVVVFDEAINEDTVAGGAGGTAPPGLSLQAAGTGTMLPVTYDFLLGGVVVVMRPVAPLPGEGAEYEVVVDPELRDLDGLRYGGTEPSVEAAFTVEADPAVEDGHVLTVLPEDNARDQLVETPIYAIFTKPAVTGSVDDTNFVVRGAGGVAITGGRGFPLTTVAPGGTPAADGRVLRFEPAPGASLPVAGDVEIELGETIRFGTNGTLDTGGRVPFASFRTLAFRQPGVIAVANPTPNFPDKINRSNVANLAIDVALGDTARVGDRVHVRVYGDDPDTQPVDWKFVDAVADVAVDGAQTVTVPFTGELGTVDDGALADGAVVLAAYVQRGTINGGFVHQPESSEPRFDLTAPTLQSFGAPGAASPTAIVTDQRAVAPYGTADEPVGRAELAAGTTTVELFGAGPSGGFLMKPIVLGQRTAPLSYTFTFWDAAGNQAAVPAQGQIVQRGVVTGSMAGSITVEAYDEVTLRPLPGVTVVLDPGLPAKPAAAGRRVATTNASGRVTFGGLPVGRYSVTLVGSGHDLFTLLDFQAAFASLPLRPTTAATATLAGTLVVDPRRFLPQPTDRGLVGCNAFADGAREALPTAPANPVAIPPTPTRPNRPLIVTAFVGDVEPTATPAYSGFACQPCGPSGVDPVAPLPPAAAGETATHALPLRLAARFALHPLAAPLTVDFADSAGLGALAGPPLVRVTGNVDGFAGSALLGVGVATAGSTATEFAVDATFSEESRAVLADFSPTLWVSTTAVDGAGNLARQRVWISDTLLGATTVVTATPDIPVVMAPGGASTGAPAVTWNDGLDAAAVLATGFAFAEIVAVDPAGRGWRLVRQDRDDATGTETVQLPPLAGLGGLAAGAWSIHVENALLGLSGAADDDYVLEQRRRTIVAFARAKPESFTVN